MNQVLRTRIPAHEPGRDSSLIVSASGPNFHWLRDGHAARLCRIFYT
jgi:hypothetical protein